MEIDSLFGLPAHPLLVHAAVVLVPLAALALVTTGWRATWRRPYALPVLLLALASAVAVVLAAGSGEPLEHAIRSAAQNAGQDARFGDHPDEGESARLWTIIFAATVMAYAAVDRFRTRTKLPTWSPLAAYGVAVACGAVATAMIIIAGHSGAELAWKNLGTFAAGRR